MSENPPSSPPELQNITVGAEHAGTRLDQFLASQLPDVSRGRVQQLIEQDKVRVDGNAAKASHRLRGGETVAISGRVQLPPLRAFPEAIPLDVIYEDDDLAVINKPAGMMVHAGAAAAGDDEEEADPRNRGTLVNALLHRFRALSTVNGQLRPGIVHRLDRDTSGLILVAKNDSAHRALAAQFSRRKVRKTYIALVHGWPERDRGTITAPISRDRQRRTRMTTRGPEGREAITHYRVVRRFSSEFGKFALVELNIETGRTHQIRVHMASVGHPVVGDTLYGAPREIRPRNVSVAPLVLGRNYLHAAAIELVHPRLSTPLVLSVPVPEELEHFSQRLEHGLGRISPPGIGPRDAAADSAVTPTKKVASTRAAGKKTPMKKKAARTSEPAKKKAQKPGKTGGGRRKG